MDLTETRRPRNQAEGQLWDLLTPRGWTLSRRGWPDFICHRGEEIAFIEVKPKRGRRLKKDQRLLLQLLAKAGFKCYRWTPPDNFEQILPTGNFF